MADTACVKCGEPWDIYHINHDEPFHVRGLLRAGKGCPSCRGVPNKMSDDEFEAMGQTLLHGGDDEDCIHQICAIEEGITQRDHSAEWDAAEAAVEVVKECEGCGLKASFEAEEIYGLYEDGAWRKAVSVFRDDVLGRGNNFGFSTSNVRVTIVRLAAGEAEAFDRKVGLELFDSKWEFETVHGKLLCSDCWCWCDAPECEEHLFVNEAHDQFVRDTYDPGASHFLQDLHVTYCTACLEAAPSCGYCSTQYKVGEEVKFDDDGLCESCSPVLTA